MAFLDDRPNGFRPIRYLGGVAYTGAVNRYFIPASDSVATFVGDLVTLAGSADSEGVATVTQSAAAETQIVGSIVGFEVDGTNLEATHRLASTAAYVLVADEPNLVFEVQEDSVGENIAATAIGNNFEIIVGAGVVATGSSGMEIDSSTKTASAAQIRLVGLRQRTDAAFGSSTSEHAKLEVMINEHAHKTTAGV